MPVILLADPDSHTRNALCQEFRKQGWDTLSAATDVDCIDLALKHVPDVLVLAVCAPELHGIHIARALASVPEFAHMRMIGLATRRDCIRYRASLESGFAAVAVKPLQPGELSRLVRDLVYTEEPALCVL